MIAIGSYNELVVKRMVDFGIYLNPNPDKRDKSLYEISFRQKRAENYFLATKVDEVLLPLKYVPENTRPGDILRVFVYTDSEDRPVATTLSPKAVVGEFACLEVKAVTSFGAFLDWGLEKDLLVPVTEQQDRMKVGRKYVVKVCLDEKTHRVYATSRIARNCEKPPADLFMGQKVGLMIYRLTKIGIMAIVNNRYSGVLYKSDTFEPIVMGEKRDGYVSRIREDGKIDLVLKKPGYHSITDSGASVMTALRERGGFIPCHDKSTPDEIRRIFSMSKKEFKRAIGGLYKAGSIDVTNEGIRIKP